MAAHPEMDDDPVVLWPAPDLSILQSGRRKPPKLPLGIFGEVWAGWITRAADAAACPCDYVAAPLIASASALIGNARWAQASAGWAEPPHLWVGSVGDSGNGKSPGADCLMRSVLPEIERRMALDFPDKSREWLMLAELARVKEEAWKSELRDAEKKKAAPPPPPQTPDIGPEPQSPRLRQYDVTIEKVATLLATAAPKGLLIVRDELGGWIDGMSAYNASGRSFWIEAYGGRPYRVERQKLQHPIDIPRHVVAVYGSTQPDKLVLLMQELDDGLMARILWSWPDPIEFRLGRSIPELSRAIAAFDKLRELDLAPGDPPRPIVVPVVSVALPAIEEFGREMQRLQNWASGLLRSAYGKARGLALRLSLVLEYLWWCGLDEISMPPSEISERAVAAGIGLVGQYFMSMAERVYGDAAVPEEERGASALARWILSQAAFPKSINVRQVQRLKLPALRESEKVKAAINVMIDANWLMPAPRRAGGSPGRQRADYAVNPRLKGVEKDD